jgi:hypothetical protein
MANCYHNFPGRRDFTGHSLSILVPCQPALCQYHVPSILLMVRWSKDPTVVTSKNWLRFLLTAGRVYFVRATPLLYVLCPSRCIRSPAFVNGFE